MTVQPWPVYVLFSAAISSSSGWPMSITSLTKVAAWTGTAAATAAARKENSAFFMVGPFGHGGRLGPRLAWILPHPRPRSQSEKWGALLLPRAGGRTQSLRDAILGEGRSAPLRPLRGRAEPAFVRRLPAETLLRIAAKRRAMREAFPPAWRREAIAVDATESVANGASVASASCQWPMDRNPHWKLAIGNWQQYHIGNNSPGMGPVNPDHPGILSNRCRGGGREYQQGGALAEPSDSSEFQDRREKERR